MFANTEEHDFNGHEVDGIHGVNRKKCYDGAFHLVNNLHDFTGMHGLGPRAPTKGWNLASVPVRRFLKPVFIRVHFVLRPVRSYILAMFWYFLGTKFIYD